MKRNTIIPVAAIALALVTSAASADVVVGTGSNTWQTFPVTLDNTLNANRPYWDNNSIDGTDANIGNYLKGPFVASGYGTITSPGITPSWWGNTGAATSNFDPNFHFTHNIAALPNNGALELEIAGTASSNIVGWFNADNPTETHVLWNGAASPTSNSAITFTPTADYGFYIIGPQGTYYTESSLNTGGQQSFQHFALFASDLTPGAEQYQIGVEDLPSNSTLEGLGDFQDFVFTVQSVPGGGSTPPAAEPASLAVLALGSAGLLLRRRK